MRTSFDKERVKRVATRQSGRITTAQLLALGGNYKKINTLISQGYLIRVLPHVYAFGHVAEDRRADLWAAVLYAGPDAMLSHVTAAHWRGLLDYPADVIEVSTPRAGVASIEGKVRVYARHKRRQGLHAGVPTTNVPDTLVDVAAVADLRVVDRALSKLDYNEQIHQRQLDPVALAAVCARGRKGSKRLRRALAAYQPASAFTNGEFERLFLQLCTRWKLPIPCFGLRIHGIWTDAYWVRYGLVIETDGLGNHSSPAQRRRDYANDLTLRSLGLTVLRYDWDQLHDRVALRLIRREMVANMREPAT